VRGDLLILRCFSVAPSRPQHENCTQKERCRKSPRRPLHTDDFAEQRKWPPFLNDAKVGVSAVRAISVKIERHRSLAIHTPEAYSHWGASIRELDPGARSGSSIREAII
jgi:hypothetical protein